MPIRFVDVEVDGRRTDVLVEGGVIAAVGATADAADDVIDGAGGALIPGLWDHHLHLLATAAALESVVVGPPEVTDAAGLRRRLSEADRATPPGRWIRAVGYHESVAGPLDRHLLDDLCDNPLRVQHRGGAQWVLNTAGCDAVGLEGGDHPGIERDGDGRVTGVITGADAWLRSRLGVDARPDLGPVGRRLASYGVVGVTDATPDVDASRWHHIADAVATGALAQHVVVMGGPALVTTTPPSPLTAGPVKIYLGDDRLPALGDVVDWIRASRAEGRTVAFHSVTRTSLAFAVAALDEAAAGPGCRIEHGSIIDPDLARELRRLGVRVVTQPSFVAERGDQYLRDLHDEDLPHLYRCATLQTAGIPVAGSTDAPYADLDPWTAVAAATRRRTLSGTVLGAADRLSGRAALDLFLSPPDDPGGAPRRVAEGEPADLCLLDGPEDRVLADPSSEHVRATIIAGRVVYLGT